MEPAVFLGPQEARTVSIISWNLNGVKTKLEKDNVKELLYRYDVISVNEVKTPLSISLPGYVTYRSAVRGSSERGGTVLFIKNHVSKLISSVDTNIEDQIWIQLRGIPDCLFGFCYIPPCGSRYYSHESFSSIQGKIMSAGACNKVFYIRRYEYKVRKLRARTVRGRRITWIYVLSDSR